MYIFVNKICIVVKFLKNTPITQRCRKNKGVNLCQEPKMLTAMNY